VTGRFDPDVLLGYVDDNRRLLALLCVLAVVTGGWLAHGAHVDPGTTTEERTAATWSTEGAFRHDAAVQRNTSLYAAGTRLENRSTYFTTLTPRLRGTYLLRAPDAPPASAETTLRLALSTTHDDGTVLWNRTEPVATATGRLGDDPLRVGFAVNVSAVRQRIATINDELGVTPSRTEVVVVAETRIEGEDWTATRSDELAIAVDGAVYTLDHRTDGPTTHSRTETVTVARDPGLTRAVGGPLLGLVGLLGLVALAGLRIQGPIPLDPDRRRAIALARDRRRFDEWISEGTVPSSDDPVVRVDSLPDLVDVAIDSDRRVIESGDRFYVLLGEARYVFDPCRSTTDLPAPTAPTEPRTGTIEQSEEKPVDGSVGVDAPRDGPGDDSGSAGGGRITGDGGSVERDASGQHDADGGRSSGATPESERS
jgi:hypothetical protein